MFNDAAFSDAITTQRTINLASLILAEFNLNDLDNIVKLGVYRYRPFGTDATYLEPQIQYDKYDTGDYYTDADVSYAEYANTDDNDPFRVIDTTKDLYYSLGDCFLPFRPRSGINKARFMSGKYIDNIRSGERPRYYMPSRKDYFKYWSSYKREGTIERGVSATVSNFLGGYGIDDAVPFVVYSKPVYANRLVVKMQTNVGSLDLGNMRLLDDTTIADPLFDYENASVPLRWKIQILDDFNTWVDAISFDESSTRIDGTPIVPKDGHVEAFYGLKIPAAYIDNFTMLGYTQEALLPNVNVLPGYAFVINSSDTAAGTVAVWSGTEWQRFPAQYGWSLLEASIVKQNGTVQNPVDPASFQSTGLKQYREIAKMNGMRVVVKTMNAPDTCFDLIEMSPRLVVDLSDYTAGYEVTKTMTGQDAGLPVSGLAASNGTLTLTNFDNLITEANAFDGTTGSIIAEHAHSNTKFTFHEIALNIDGYNKYIPIKTFYADQFPKPTGGTADVSIPLRDFYFRLETVNAPTFLYQDTTLTYAVSAMLDYIGFSNYVFLNITEDNDPVLPYFFVEPNVSVAEILQRIALATQSPMFFDEYNNFIVMARDYMLPVAGTRDNDIVLSGNDVPLANIESMVENQTAVINNGTIDYTIRYVQRAVSSLSSSILLDNERTYKYKPVLLWEVAANTETKTTNEASKQASGFALGAAALNADLAARVPTVSKHAVIDNTIDLGESIYWLPKFQGYLYANGEIIRYDAVEYAIPNAASSLVWITNNQEYQRYFSKLAFNGKIYPTGRIRIFSEPYYEDIAGTAYMKDGAVRIHGRGQFGTDIVAHSAGLPSYWSDNANCYGISMDSSLIFSTKQVENITNPALGATTRVESATVRTIAQRSTRNGIIKNFMAGKVYEDGYVNKLKTTNAGTVQASALVFKGPTPDTTVANHRDLVSYVYKDLSTQYPYRHFGTRMRIIGKIVQDKAQVANGSSNYFSIQSASSTDPLSIDGGSGGLGIFVDPTNGAGYYLEIVALGDKNIEKYAASESTTETDPIVHNIQFYKVNTKAKSGSAASSQAIPQKLWGGLTSIGVDAGIFVGQDRLGISQDNTVYDLSIEYEKISGGAIRFYLYINNILIKIVDDTKPLAITTHMALFVRGGSECMFENVYALEDMIARNDNSVIIKSPTVFDDNSLTTNDAMRKYALSGIIQQSYLSSMKPDSGSTAKIYFEEFGTILRECVHFDIKYDQAFPAFYSKIAKTFTTDRSYTVSGFYGGAYEAEFMVFNAADKTITLDDTTGSYLRILGVTFTQNTTQQLTVDNYYSKLSNAADPYYQSNELVSPLKSLQAYNQIKASRAKYGDRAFSLASMYVQSDDQARELMGWLVDKTMRPRKDITITTFPLPHLQVGDMVGIQYTMEDGVEYTSTDKQFIVKEISIGRSAEGINQSVRVIEV